MELEPVGRQANEGLLARLWRRIAGSSQDGPVWYQLEGGPGTEVLDVGAAPGTDVYSPVDGTVVSISDFVIDGKAYGSRIDVRPSAAPSLIVTLSHLAARSVARGRQPRARVLLQARHRSSTSRPSSGRRSRSTRARAATTSRSTCTPPPDRCPEPSSSSRTSSAVPAARRSRTGSRRCGPSSTPRVCIVNGENVADGVGITPKLAERLLAAGRRRDHARQPHLAPPGDRALPRRVGSRDPAGEPRRPRPRAGAHRRRRRRRDAGRRRQRDGLAVAAARAEHVGDRRRARRRGRARRHRSCSSTSTPRRRARRSRSPAGSTVA